MKIANKHILKKIHHLLLRLSWIICIIPNVLLMAIIHTAAGHNSVAFLEAQSIDILSNIYYRLTVCTKYSILYSLYLL